MLNFKGKKSTVLFPFFNFSGRGRRHQHEEGRLEGEARQHPRRDQGGEEDQASLCQERHRGPDRRQMIVQRRRRSTEFCFVFRSFVSHCTTSINQATDHERLSICGLQSGILMISQTLFEINLGFK